MISITPSPSLPIAALANSFEHVTTSYKFYWFLALLESVSEHDERVFEIDSLLARMIAYAWYAVNDLRLSLGDNDQLKKLIDLLIKNSSLDIDSSRDCIIQTVLTHLQQEDNIGRKIRSLERYVPYRFIRPFFDQALRGLKDQECNRRIRDLADWSFTSPQPCLYRFVNIPAPAIEIHPDWQLYLQQHRSVLTKFCLRHLTNYLQKNNPNVPSIAEKLFESQTKDSLPGH